MGLVNTSHSVMTQSVIDLQSDLLKNPFYLFNDKKGLPVEYFNVNKNRSTLDDTLKIAYDSYDKESPIRYNLIHGLYLYGLDRVALSLEHGEFGVEASEVSGDAVVLPGTITPYPGDHFVIAMIKQRYVFKVNSVTMDTFDNGANYWRLEYSLFSGSDKEFLDQVTDEYSFVSGNVGTEYAPVLASKKFDVCKNLDDVAVNLKKLFKGLYYNDKVQTYTFVYLYQLAQTSMETKYFYDPYMIEFCIRHKVLENSGDKFDFLDHKTYLKPEFSIKYNRSIWKILETREKDELPGCKYSSSAAYIDDPGTIFASRYEDYFEMTYDAPNPLAEVLSPAMNVIDPQIIGHILDDQLFPSDSKFAKYNVLIKYFNYHDTIGTEDIIPLERIVESENNMENYYLIPMTIFCLEFYIKNMMAVSPETSITKTK